MLLQFTVGNFLSFNKEAVLSTAVPKTAPSDPRYVESGEFRASRTIALYGANASGKSNLIKALAKAQELVVQGTRPETAIDVTPFKLDPEARKRPSTFQFDIVLDGTLYSYGFAASREVIEDEWLVRGSGESAEELFSRTQELPPKERPKFKLGPISKDAQRLEGALHFVAETTRANQLFLTHASENAVQELRPITEWFRQGLALWFPENNLPPWHWMAALADSSARRFAGELLWTLGTGVSRVELGDPQRYSNLTGVAGEIARRVAERDPERIRLYHGDHPDIEFRLEEESDGTRRLLQLAPRLHSVLRNTQVTVIDEIDRSLHPLLTRQLVHAFQSGPVGPSQLVFTTHDTNLLDLSLLTQYAIWFVEKDKSGASQLYSLAEYKQDQLDALKGAVEKGYLLGRFGAIPFLGDPSRLGWIPKA